MHLERDEFTVTYNSSKCSPNEIIQAIKDSGYSARVVAQELVPLDQPSSPPIPRDVEPLATALREARETRRPIFLDFHADWCVPCKRMEEETFSDERIAELLDQYVVLKLNTDEHLELSKSFGVAGLPDIRLLSEDGLRQVQLLGFKTADALAPELESFLDSSP